MGLPSDDGEPARTQAPTLLRQAGVAETRVCTCRCVGRASWSAAHGSCGTSSRPARHGHCQSSWTELGSGGGNPLLLQTAGFGVIAGAKRFDRHLAQGRGRHDYVLRNWLIICKELRYVISLFVL